MLWKITGGIVVFIGAAVLATYWSYKLLRWALPRRLRVLRDMLTPD